MSAVNDFAKKRVKWVVVAIAALAIGGGYYAYKSYYLPSELRLAATKGDVQRVEQLLSSGVDVNRPLGLPSNSVLNRAVEGGNTEIVEAVLRAGADPNATGETGMTPLMFAAFFGHTSIIETLLRHGAKAGVVEDRHKNTALLIAIRKGHAEAVAALLKAGADPNQGHSWGDAPLCRAQASSRSDIAAILKQAGAVCP